MNVSAEQQENMRLMSLDIDCMRALKHQLETHKDDIKENVRSLTRSSNSLTNDFGGVVAEKLRTTLDKDLGKLNGVATTLGAFIRKLNRNIRSAENALDKMKADLEEAEHLFD